MKNLTFSYDEEQQILHNSFVDIHRGKKYALVGKNGCGKSTLVKLLRGYYSDYQGFIQYDNVNLKSLNYTS